MHLFHHCFSNLHRQGQNAILNARRVQPARKCFRPETKTFLKSLSFQSGFNPGPLICINHYQEILFGTTCFNMLQSYLVKKDFEPWIYLQCHEIFTKHFSFFILDSSLFSKFSSCSNPPYVEKFQGPPIVGLGPHSHTPIPLPLVGFLG